MTEHCNQCGHPEYNCTCRQQAQAHEGIKRATYGKED